MVYFFYMKWTTFLLLTCLAHFVRPIYVMVGRMKIVFCLHGIFFCLDNDKRPQSIVFRLLRVSAKIRLLHLSSLSIPEWQENTRISITITNVIVFSRAWNILYGRRGNFLHNNGEERKKKACRQSPFRAKMWNSHIFLSLIMLI